MIKKAKAHLKSNLVRDMKGNKKGFQRPTNSRRTHRWKSRTDTEWGREPSDNGHG